MYCAFFRKKGDKLFLISDCREKSSFCQDCSLCKQIINTSDTPGKNTFDRKKIYIESPPHNFLYFFRYITQSPL